jgi:hypothetical protein
MVSGWNLIIIIIIIIIIIKNGFTSSTFPFQPDFSQNQVPAITLNTGSSRTLNITRLIWDEMVTKAAELRQSPLPSLFCFGSSYEYRIHYYHSEDIREMIM